MSVILKAEAVWKQIWKVQRTRTDRPWNYVRLLDLFLKSKQEDGTVKFRSPKCSILNQALRQAGAITRGGCWYV